MTVYLILGIAATIAALLIIFFLQRKNNSNDTNENILNFSEFRADDSSHPNSSIIITYPQITQLEYRKTNQLIEDFVNKLAEDAYGKNYQNLNMKLSYKITYTKNKLLSIVFEGIGNQTTSAYLNNLIFALNINLESESIVSLSDIYYITSETIEVIKKSFNKNFIPKKLEEWGVTKNSESYDKYLGQIKNVCPGDIEDALLDKKKFYFSEKSLVICTSVPHTIGDYFEAETEYQKLTEFLKTNKKPFC